MYVMDGFTVKDLLKFKFMRIVFMKFSFIEIMDVDLKKVRTA